MNRFTLVASLSGLVRKPNRRYATDFIHSEYSQMTQQTLWLKKEIAFVIRNTQRLVSGHRG